MNCRKTGNQTKNRIYVKHNKREPRGGEGRRMTGIIMLSVSRQWPNPRDRLTIMITQRRSVNEFRRNEHKLETMQLPPCSSIYRERECIEREREKKRGFTFALLRSIVHTSCLSFPSSLSFFFLFFFLFFDSFSDELHIHFYLRSNMHYL